MYLSKIDLDLTKSGVRKDLGNHHQLHQKVMMGFPDQRESTDLTPQENNECRKNWQILFRLEGATLLVQSGVKPNWSRLPTGYTPDGEIRELDFQTIQSGQRLKFRLVANPVQQRTHKRTDEDGNPILKADGSGKPQQKTWRRLITKENDQIQWLVNHLKGAKLEECYITAPSKINRDHQSSIIRTVQFDGVLQVVNPSEFLDVLTNGIGRGRSYGCGLLSIARIL
ncbi:MAG: type I-E CRISPR-associated protein Cas6/Cse3/CasE [Cyanobacteriota bacterium]|nr:type I-E CRISPR-associated protein Cas6/Cse3/CasE [Cyanobacteriota bacterium]